MAVYVAAHKKASLPEERGYIPLQVGAAIHPPLPYAGDNTGEHISEKNTTYCELTGLYWVWRNTTDAYKGLVHYRRYFAIRGCLLTEEEITYYLTDYDIILPNPEPLRECAWQEFCLHSGFEHDLRLTRQAVEAVDAAMLPTFDAVMAGGSLHLYNMLIAPAAEFDAYCSWLFEVLERVEQEISLEGYTDYQQRVFGFLGERLLNVWVAYRGLRVCHLAVKNTENTRWQEARMWLRRRKNRLLGPAAKDP